MNAGAGFAKRERPQHRGVLEAAIGSARRNELSALLGRLARELGIDASGTAVSGFAQVRAALDRTWAALACQPRSALDADMLLDLQRFDREIRDAEIQHQARSLRAARDALGRLQDIASVSRLLDAGTAAICGLGFDRAIISRVDHHRRVTGSLHVDGDSEWAMEIPSADRQDPQPISKGIAYRIVRRRRFVRGAEQNVVPDSSAPRSYVAAPLMPSSEVIGFVHGDRFVHKDELTSFDADLLHVFAEGFGHALERALTLRRIGEIRADLLGGSPGLGLGKALDARGTQAHTERLHGRRRLDLVTDVADDGSPARHT